MLKSWIVSIAVIWVLGFVTSIGTGHVVFALLTAIILLFMLLMAILPQNRVARTINYLIHLLILISLALTIMSTAIVIYLDQAYLGLIDAVCEADLSSE